MLLGSIMVCLSHKISDTLIMDDLFVARLLINHLRLGYFGVCNTGW